MPNCCPWVGTPPIRARPSSTDPPYAAAGLTPLSINYVNWRSIGSWSMISSLFLPFSHGKKTKQAMAFTGKISSPASSGHWSKLTTRKISSIYLSPLTDFFTCFLLCTFGGIVVYNKWQGGKTGTVSSIPLRPQRKKHGTCVHVETSDEAENNGIYVKKTIQLLKPFTFVYLIRLTLKATLFNLFF